MAADRTFRVFLFIAPPIGWLIYAVGVVAGEAFQGHSFETLLGGLVVALLGLPVSYLFGIPVAFFAALLMTWATSLTEERPGPVLAAIVGLVCGLCFALLFHRESDALPLGVSGYVVLKVLTCLVPTLICWWLVCRDQRTANEQKS